MRSGAKRKASLHTPRNTMYFVCKSCGKTEQEASLSSSSASSKAGPPLPKRTKSNPAAAELRYKSFPHYQKLDVVFAGRSATGSPSAQNPAPNTQRTSYSGSKRKALEPNALDKIVERIDLVNAAIAEKTAKKEAYSIEKVIDLLNTFDELDPMQYNCALDHFREEVNRRIFMYLTKERQKHYIEHIIHKNMQ